MKEFGGRFIDEGTSADVKFLIAPNRMRNSSGQELDGMSAGSQYPAKKGRKIDEEDGRHAFRQMLKQVRALRISVFNTTSEGLFKECYKFA